MTNEQTSTVANESATSAKGGGTALTLWRIALADYEREVAALAVISAAHDEAGAELEKAVPGQPADREHYNLDTRRDRDRLIRDTEIAITVREYPSILAARDNDALTADDYTAITRRAVEIVDGYLDWRRAYDEASARIFEPAEKAWEEALDKVHHARNALLSTPAPDPEAMTYKLDVLAALMVEGGEQDAPAVVAIRDDARRLFGDQ